MTRYLIVLLTLLLLCLSGCNQSSDATTEEATQSPMAEQPPAEFITEEQAQEVEEVAEEGPSEQPGTIPELILCMDPRPEICTQNYAPVCGQDEDGSRQTYSNGCVACSNAEVVGALPGACPV